jgi:hypothetical protein
MILLKLQSVTFVKITITCCDDHILKKTINGIIGKCSQPEELYMLESEPEEFHHLRLLLRFIIGSSWGFCNLVAFDSVHSKSWQHTDFRPSSPTIQTCSIRCSTILLHVIFVVVVTYHRNKSL